MISFRQIFFSVTYHMVVLLIMLILRTAEMMLKIRTAEPVIGLVILIPALTEDVTDNTYGKPTRWMAEALLAKLYINWAVYTAESVDQYDAATAANPKLDDVIATCDDIIQSGKFNLGSREIHV